MRAGYETQDEEAMRRVIFLPASLRCLLPLVSDRVITSA